MIRPYSDNPTTFVEVFCDWCNTVLVQEPDSWLAARNWCQLRLGDVILHSPFNVRGDEELDVEELRDFCCRKCRAEYVQHNVGSR